MQPLAAPAGIALLLLSSFAASQSVHVVDDDGGPGVDFTGIAEAVNAAASGDMILVKTGAYLGFTIAGKSLVVAEDQGNFVNVLTPIEVSGLAADQRVVLRGLSLFNSLIDVNHELFDNAGWIGIEDCEIVNQSFPVDRLVEVENTSVLFFSRCTIEAAQALATPAVAIAARTSTLVLYQTSVTGSHGLASAVTDGNDGGAAITLEGSFLFASGATIRGGDGADGGPLFGCHDGGAGGNGIEAVGAAQVRLHSTTLAGGAGGVASGAPCTDGADGVAAAGVIPSLLAGEDKLFFVESPVRMGDFATNRFFGAPGDVVMIAIALAPGAVFFPQWLGAIAIGPPVLTQTVGVVPASGMLTVDVLTPVLPGISFLPFWEQAGFLGGGQFTLASPSFPVLLEPSL